MVLGWIQGRPILEMFNISVRWVSIFFKFFLPQMWNAFSFFF
jgi:hypothetical protein